MPDIHEGNFSSSLYSTEFLSIYFLEFHKIKFHFRVLLHCHIKTTDRIFWERQ